MSICTFDEHLLSPSLADVAPEPLRWLWRGRILLGKVTVLDGDPGLGKSLVTLDLAARVTTGREMPDGTPGVDGGVVLLSAEDDIASTILPRLRAARADVMRIVAPQMVRAIDPLTGRERERDIVLPGDLPLLEQEIARVDAKLVVIDPLMAYLDTRVNSWRDQDVRAALTPLKWLAERTGAAILLLRHLNKGSGSAIYRGGGSIGIIGSARGGLLVAKDPDDPEHVRVLASAKSNLGPPVPALRYRLTAVAEDAMPTVEWLGTCAQTADELLAAQTPAGGDVATQIETAVAFLREALAEGARPGTDVRREAREQGISEATLRRAVKRLGVVAAFTGRRENGCWMWSLPRGEVRDADAGAARQEMLITPTDAHVSHMSISSADAHLLAQPVTGSAADTPGERAQTPPPPRDEPCPATGRPHTFHPSRSAPGLWYCPDCKTAAVSPDALPPEPAPEAEPATAGPPARTTMPDAATP